MVFDTLGRDLTWSVFFSDSFCRLYCYTEENEHVWGRRTWRKDRGLTQRHWPPWNRTNWCGERFRHSVTFVPQTTGWWTMYAPTTTTCGTSRSARSWMSFTENKGEHRDGTEQRQHYERVRGKRLEGSGWGKSRTGFHSSGVEIGLAGTHWKVYKPGLTDWSTTWWRTEKEVELSRGAMV